MPVQQEWHGLLFDGTDDDYVVRSEHELHLLQHNITTNRVGLSDTRGMTVNCTYTVTDDLKALPGSGHGAPDWETSMILAVGNGGVITAVQRTWTADSSLPTIVVKWRYSSDHHHDKAYHAVRVPAATGTVLFEFDRPKRGSVKAHPDIEAPWAQAPAHRPMAQRPVEHPVVPFQLEQRPADDFLALSTPTASSVGHMPAVEEGDTGSGMV